MEQLNPNPSPNSGNNKKNILLWILVIFSALSVVLFSGYYLKKNFGSQKAEMQKPVSLEESALVKVSCNFSNDEEASQKALEEKNISVCLCIKDEQKKSRCQESAQNAAYFAQARAQFKANFCDLIKNNNGLKNSCVAMVSSGIEYLKKEDPGYLAGVYSVNGNYDKAIEILAVSEKIKTEASSMLLLALNYAGKGLMEHREGEYIPKAEELVNKAIVLNSESAEAYRVQGYVYEIKPDLFKSIESYNKSLEKDPNYILSLVGRGHAFNLIGDLNKALEDFKKAAELDKNKENISIYANLCRLQTSRGDLLAEGIKNCQMVLNFPATGAELKSDTAQILADAYVKEKRFDEALIQLESARVFSPQSVNLFVSFANLYNEKEDYAKAIEEAQKALVIDPSKTAAYNALAQAFLKTQDYIQAEKKALKGLEVINKDPSLLVPNKPYFIKQLNYTLADIFAAKGDKGKEAQYRETGDRAMGTK